MRAISCRVKIELTNNIQRNLTQHRRSDSVVKKQLLNIIYSLLREGYRHFIIDIDSPADYWFAELIYAVAIANKGSGIRYSIACAVLAIILAFFTLFPTGRTLARKIFDYILNVFGARIEITSSDYANDPMRRSI